MTEAGEVVAEPEEGDDAEKQEEENATELEQEEAELIKPPDVVSLHL